MPVEALVNPGCWGYNYRIISGSTSFSNHASGTAIERNAPRHPLGASGSFSSAQGSRIGSILSYCNGVCVGVATTRGARTRCTAKSTSVPATLFEAHDRSGNPGAVVVHTAYSAVSH